jgi:hypothetical protein
MGLMQSAYFVGMSASARGEYSATKVREEKYE